MHWTKKFVSFLLLLAVLLCLLAACAQTSQEDHATATASGLPELRIGVDTLKPFFYLDETGAYAGIDAEIATEACQRAGYTPVFVEIPWSERDTYLADGRVDCLWTAFIQNGRENDYLWTEPYLDSKLAAIVDERCPDHSLQEFCNRVAVRAGSMAQEWFRTNAASGSSIYACGTFAMAETAFVKGYAGALAGHEAVLRQILEENPDVYRFLSDEMMSVHLGVAFNKADGTGRCQAISDAIHAMKQDGTLAALAEKYGMTVPDEEGGSTDAASDQ